MHRWSVLLILAALAALAAAAPSAPYSRTNNAFSSGIPASTLAASRACSRVAQLVDTHPDVLDCFSGPSPLFFASLDTVCSTVTRESVASGKSEWPWWVGANGRGLPPSGRSCYEVTVWAAGQLAKACPQPKGQGFEYWAWANEAAARDACTAFTFDYPPPRPSSSEDAGHVHQEPANVPLKLSSVPPAVRKLSAVPAPPPLPAIPARGDPVNEPEPTTGTKYALHAVFDSYMGYRSYAWTGVGTPDDAQLKRDLCTEPMKLVWRNVKNNADLVPQVYFMRMPEAAGMVRDAARVCATEDGFRFPTMAPSQTP